MLQAPEAMTTRPTRPDAAIGAHQIVRVVAAAHDFTVVWVRTGAEIACA